VKIALITGSAGDGHCGVGDYTYELAQHLALDAQVHLYYDHDHGPLETPYPQLTSIHMHPVSGFSLFVLKQVSDELRAGDFDIVHLQYPGKGYGTSLGPGFIPQNLSGMKSRSRTCVTLHEWSTSHPLRRLVMEQMLKSVDGVLTTSPFEMEALASRVRNQQRIMAIPVGNILSSRRELDAVWAAAEKRSVVQLAAPQGAAGRVPLSLFHFGLPARGKGFTRLLQALHILREAHGIPALLYLAGDFVPGEAATEEVLSTITGLNLADSVVRLSHLPREHIWATAETYMLGVFPFDEGFSTKRSSVAALSECDLPLVVGGGALEEHPYYAPRENTGEALAALLLELLSGRAEREWTGQVVRQREYARRFSFTNIAQSHLSFYSGLRKIDT
jgi:glycosyltransferase involved in cell wall biosynthesis